MSNFLPVDCSIEKFAELSKAIEDEIVSLSGDIFHVWNAEIFSLPQEDGSYRDACADELFIEYRPLYLDRLEQLRGDLKPYDQMIVTHSRVTTHELSNEVVIRERGFVEPSMNTEMSLFLRSERNDRELVQGLHSHELAIETAISLIHRIDNAAKFQNEELTISDTENQHAGSLLRRCEIMIVRERMQVLAACGVMEATTPADPVDGTMSMKVLSLKLELHAETIKGYAKIAGLPPGAKGRRRVFTADEVRLICNAILQSKNATVHSHSSATSLIGSLPKPK